MNMKKPVVLVATSVLATLFAISSASSATVLNRNTAKPSLSSSRIKLAPRSATQLRLQVKNSASAKALNPQPLPPGPDSMRASSQAKALNPQPLPPGPAGAMRASMQAKALNPQPLPPGPDSMRASSQAKALNPQPLPPGPAGAMRANMQAKALNPQPLPPGPDKGKSASARTSIKTMQSAIAKRAQSIQQSVGGMTAR